DTLTREVTLKNRRFRFIDTVGFIRKLPHNLIASFRATLEEAGSADVLVHVIDASHPEWEEHVTVVDAVLADLSLDGKTVIHAFNRMDVVADPAAFRQQVEARYAPAATIAARQGDLRSLFE